MMLTELNLHRVVLTAILLAAKFFDDAYYNNAYYAKVGGVLVSELNGLEVDFLFRINFSLRVTPDEFEKYRRELMSRSDVVAAGLSTIAPAELPLSCPAPIAPKVYYTENCAATEQSRYHSDCSHQSCPQETVDKSLITPSPPSTAAASDMVEALVNAVNNSPDSFYTRLGIPSVNRTNSMPVLPKSSSPSCYRQHHGSGRPQHQHQQPYYHMPNSDPVHVRCSRPMSAMPQFPRPDDPFGVMNMNGTLLYKTVTTHISCTTTTPLIHHHHGGSFHHNSISDSGYVVVSMSDTGS